MWEMVMFRSLFMLLVACFLFANESMAVGIENEENKENFSTPTKKLKIETDAITPTSKQEKYFDEVRQALARQRHITGAERNAVPSPDAKGIYKKNDIGEFFNHETIVLGRRILIHTGLIDLNDEVYDRKRGWETNEQRMRTGRAPVAKKGIVRKDQGLSADEILKIQNPWKIELHHTTQKDYGNENAIVAIPRHVHHGHGKWMIFQIDTTGQISLVMDHLTQEEVLNFPFEEGQFPGSPHLNFRMEDSYINRSRFGKCRTEYWKEMVPEREKENSTTLQPVSRQLFVFED